MKQERTEQNGARGGLTIQVTCHGSETGLGACLKLERAGVRGGLS